MSMSILGNRAESHPATLLASQGRKVKGQMLQGTSCPASLGYHPLEHLLLPLTIQSAQVQRCCSRHLNLEG